MQIEGPLAHVIGDFVHRLEFLEHTMIDLPTLLADIATLKTDIDTLIADFKTTPGVDLQPAADAVAAIQAEVLAAPPPLPAVLAPHIP
jgi:hypothetical protein